jgi:uncharacterized protein YqjF (DUF2071 family)
MAASEPEQQVRVPVLMADWLSVAFVHWPVDAAAVQAMLPPGLTVDLYDHQAWLTITPLRMAGVGLPYAGALPRLTFAETNVRTYVRVADERDGIYFLQIEAASALMTMAARAAAGAPYELGDLSIVASDGLISYGGALRDGRCSYRIDVRPGERIVDPSPQDVWLTGRWRAYTWHLGRLLETPVEHEPWPLSTATVDVLQQTITEAWGLPGPGLEPLAHFSEGVRNVRLGVSRPVR